MDSLQPLAKIPVRLNAYLRRALQRYTVTVWMPLLLTILAVAYGLAVASIPSHGHLGNHPATTSMAKTELFHAQLDTQYIPFSLNEVLATEAWRDDNWMSGSSGIGYLDTPATFRFTVTNRAPYPVNRMLVVAAPFLDHIVPVAIDRNGFVSPLPAMGDTHPFQQRLYNLPQWVWPLTLPPQSDTLFLFEVTNSGPTMLPISLMDPDTLVGSGAAIIAWKAFLYGVLVFALAFNLIMLSLLKKSSIAWLSVLIVTIIYNQLVLDGFGLWLLWPDLPKLNGLLAVTLPLSAVAMCQFTRHFLALDGTNLVIINGFSIAAGLLIMTTPLPLPLPGQGSLLVLGIAACGFALIVALRQVRQNVYARYYALAMLAILVGILLASLRTVGWLPVNELTNSGHYLGAALAAVILTTALAQRLLDERRRRLGAVVKVRQEQELRTKLESEYERLLRTHRITGKPNRSMLEETLERLHLCGNAFSLCLVRFERYPEIEQALGYKETENLLRLYLERLDRYLRARLGDQLVLINGSGVATVDTMSHAFALSSSAASPASERLWTDITRWLEASFVEGRYSFNWTPSLGVAHAPEHGSTSSELLSRAGFATLDPTQTLTVYDPSVAVRLHEQQVLMLDLDSALENDQIHLVYQPKVLIANAETVSFEALIRWDHPEFGRVTPDRWIPLAEQVGVIYPVTLWVLNRACRDWPLLAAKHGPDTTVAINVSVRDLAQEGFEQTAIDILDQYGIDPGNVILELTETAVMSNVNQARAMVRTLSDAGFGIALDDFGTGHSSLSALAGFALDEIKIDRSFLHDITHDAARQRIFRTAVELGEALSLRIVVEGVETKTVAEWLNQFPGLCGQGYYWGLPQSVAALCDESAAQPAAGGYLLTDNSADR
ncbi:EAL domain-containing protein [Marinobacter caseinilyticus]|uniref:EAL domain-containing protein n=1 Tax=Marinobacter caseinilyticus TaxID=2692195 RepID=UPI0014096024|nr:EAL domain-containing protein [Marinobacter caseinilyticus]